ncbi:neuromedin-U [Cricetulus griseus]|uniref:Neuromedin-U n=1 Tax=Cricetulus griseus TaxID=10029 RepID=A0A061IPX1_CRIGR|nr:neuromedin-U [Cricetulus griseus]XP_035317820.1 neuromedin-U [Cricetulus griseus]ERE90741.1 neuromedin-U-like protein [Cricetulus griseus]
MSRAAGSRPGLSGGQVAAASPLLSLLLLLACFADACRGAPVSPQRIRSEQELQLWNKVHDACSSFLSSDSQPQGSTALREFCRLVTESLQKPLEQNEKHNTKRFLFHYSKTEKSGNSNIVSSVVHPLLQLVPQLHERRMKRFKEELQSPFAGQSRGYFLFRPRNGKRSAGFI